MFSTFRSLAYPFATATSFSIAAYVPVLLAESTQDGTAGMAHPTTLLGAMIAAFTVFVGLVVWIVRRLLDVTIPNQQALFSAGLTQIDTANKSAIDKLAARFDSLQETFKLEMSAERLAAERRLIEERAAAEKRLTEERAFFLKLMADTQKSYLDGQAEVLEAVTGLPCRTTPFLAQPSRDR